MPERLQKLKGRIIGNWRVLEVLGEGAHGIVYAVEHTTLPEKRAALKIPHRSRANNAKHTRRFLIEATAASRISHPNIVSLYDYGVAENDECYLVMELLEGTTLADALRKGRLESTRAANIAIQVARGLEAAHQAGIIHRDLKPDNIMLLPAPDGGDRVKLVDFGVAKLTHDDPAHLHTNTGDWLGCRAYMSPEQWKALSNIDGRTDIYSLGIILFECLTGHLPFSADTDYEWLMAHLEKAIPDAATLVPIPKELAELVTLMMAKERAGRPQSMEQVVLKLQWYDKTVSVPASLTAPAPALLSFARNRLPVTLLGAGLLVVAMLKLGADRMAWQKPVGSQDKPTQPLPAQVLVPGGCFVMGSQLSDLTDIDKKWQVPDHEKDQLPAHCMQVASFYLDRTEVTVSAYRQCVKAGSCQASDSSEKCSMTTGTQPGCKACNWGKPDHDNHPINCVSWDQATHFCNWLGRRLPTETEFEYAMRGPQSSQYAWGNDQPISNKQLCYQQLAEGTCPVAQFPPTLRGQLDPNGVFDLGGNVWEYTSSLSSRSSERCTYPLSSSICMKSNLNNMNVCPSIEHNINCEADIYAVRGGAWTVMDPTYYRAAFRNYQKKASTNPTTGFRCASDGPSVP